MLDKKMLLLIVYTNRSRMSYSMSQLCKWQAEIDRLQLVVKNHVTTEESIGSMPARPPAIYSSVGSLVGNRLFCILEI